MGTMYDSINPLSIPLDAQIVAGYVDGNFAWADAVWAQRWPNAVHVRISVIAPNVAGDVLDVETGDATPQQAPGWILGRQRAGLAYPVIYCNKNTAGAVQAACAGLNYGLWVADPTGQAHLLPGTVAVQYAWASLNQTGGIGNVDISTTVDWWPGGNMTQEEHDWLAQVAAFLDQQLGPNFSSFQQATQDVSALKTAVANLQQPQVDAAAVATALAGNQAFLDAMAAAVAQKFSKDLAVG